MNDVDGPGKLPSVSCHSCEPHPGAAGLPPPQTIVEIADLETGMTILPVGQSGEVCIRGPQVMKGYWNRPKETALAFRGGRFHTGDIGFIDEHGYLTLANRRDIR